VQPGVQVLAAQEGRRNEAATRAGRAAEEGEQQDHEEGEEGQEDAGADPDGERSQIRRRLLLPLLIASIGRVPMLICAV